MFSTVVIHEYSNAQTPIFTAKEHLMVIKCEIIFFFLRQPQVVSKSAKWCFLSTLGFPHISVALNIKFNGKESLQDSKICGTCIF